MYSDYCAYLTDNCMITFIVGCPVKGQIRKECAAHPDCHRTCNSTGNASCPQICIVNGCECPFGTIINEEKNECVRPRDCKGTYTRIV